MSKKEILIVILEAIKYYFVICKREWWKKPPFLPIPSFKYIRWRLDTAYGASFPRPPLKVIIRDTAQFLLWRYKFKKEG